MKREIIEVNRRVKRTLGYARDFLTILLRAHIAICLLFSIPILVNYSLTKITLWGIAGFFTTTIILYLKHSYKKTWERANEHRFRNTKRRLIREKLQIKKLPFHDYFYYLMDKKERTEIESAAKKYNPQNDPN